MLPAVRGVIDRRILVNYRVDPDALDAVLPEPFEPLLVDDAGVGGICLIRLANLRPQPLPAAVGTTTENAAHRIAVEWEIDGERQQGVYVPRRDTSSRLATALGGHIFAGEYGYAAFEVAETDDRFSVRMESDDADAAVQVEAERSSALPDDSVFESLDHASEFFRRGSLGYSPGDGAETYDGVELCTDDWAMEPLAVDAVHSSFFEDDMRFEANEVSFDSALLMRNIDHEWQTRESLCAPA